MVLRAAVLVKLALKAHHGPAAASVSLAICTLTLLLNGRTVMLPQLLAGLTRPVNVGLLLAVGFAPATAYLSRPGVSGDFIRWEDEVHGAYDGISERAA